MRSKGRHVRRPPPVPEGKAYDAWIGMYFDPATWDGSDIFISEGSTTTIVTSRLKEQLESADVTNIRFTPLTEFERRWKI